MPIDSPPPVALVTGAGAPRVGKTIARTLSAKGYRLAVHAHRSIDRASALAQQLSAQGPHAVAVQADLRKETDVARMFDQIDAEFGRIDAIVHAAAIWESKPLEQVLATDVQRHWEANALSTFLVAQQGGLRMVSQQDGGVIVLLGDWAVIRPYPDHTAYFPSKGAIPVITRNFAIELAARNPRVRVNAVLPGPVMLPPDLPTAERQASIQGTLVKREGRPEHVAHAVVFLMENTFVTGVCLPVDGGRSLGPG